MLPSPVTSYKADGTNIRMVTNGVDGRDCAVYDIQHSWGQAYDGSQYGKAVNYESIDYQHAQRAYQEMIR